MHISDIIKAINAERAYVTRTKTTDLITSLESKLWADLCKAIAAQRDKYEEFCDDGINCANCPLTEA